MNTNQSSNLSTETGQRIDEMDRELRFLWQEAHEEIIVSMKERKLKQYWELFRAYKKQKLFLTALEK